MEEPLRSPKRILIFSLSYHPFVGGAEVALKELTDRLGDSYAFDMVTLRFDTSLPKVEQVGKVRVHRIGFGKDGASVADTFSLLAYLSKILFIPLAALEGLRLDRTHRYDGLWAMMSYMLFPVTLMRFLGTKRPYLVSLQDGDPFEHVFSRPLIRPFRFLLEDGFKNARAIQALSTFLLSWGKRMGFKGEGIVIPNGVDIEAFSTPAAKAKEIRARYTRPDETLLITTSRLVRKNAIDDVIRALALLPSSVRFLIVGEGSERPALEALSEELGESERVMFIGSKPHSELPGYLQASDIFVRPSRSEGMGNSFIEAFAAGIPVIGTQEGGLKEFLFDAKRNPGEVPTGFVVDKDSPQQIAEALKRILANTKEAKEVVENARTFAKRYDWKRVAEEMRALFDRTFREG